MTDDELRKHYWPAPRAGLEIGLPTHAVYRLVQTGQIVGVVADGHWFVSINSALSYKRKLAERGVVVRPADEDARVV